MWVFIRYWCSLSGPPTCWNRGCKLWNTPHFSLDDNITSCSEDMRTTVLCQNGSDNNYRTKPTSAWALVANVMNFELLFTTEVIPPSRWVSNRSCKLRLGRNRQSISSITQWRYYNVSNWPPETFFKGQRTRFGKTAFHLPPTYWSAAQSKYFLHFPFPNGR
jgi:hypothetical protein